VRRPLLGTGQGRRCLRLQGKSNWSPWWVTLPTPGTDLVRSRL
jgi:hypothetical protein